MRLGLCFLLLLTACAGAPAPPAADDVVELPWEEVLAQAREQQVSLGMWAGDPSINSFIGDWVAPRLAERHGIELNVVSAEGREIVNLLLTELEAGKVTSELDVVWINGENFYKLRQIGALAGPFTQALPNMRWVDQTNPFIGFDFQQPIEGFEAPWGNVQLTLIYDAERVSDPPRDRHEIAAWVREHPGRFTWDMGFAGMTFLKGLVIDIAGGGGALNGPFDEELYLRASEQLWEWVREVQPFLWKQGRTFPSTVAQLHQLFAAGEVDFTMSNNDGEVDTKVLQGIFPDTARAYVLDSGTIQNTHYLGIPRHAGAVAGALVTIDFLLSPEAQYEKLKPAVWGDGSVLDVDRLPPEWQERFRNVPERRHAPPREAIAEHALQEPDAEYMVRLYDDFRREVLGG